MLTLSPTYLNICIFSVSLLTLASLINLTLTKLKPANLTLPKVRIIIKSWWLIIGVLLLAALFGSNGFLMLFVALNLLIIREYLKNTRLQYAKRTLSLIMYVSVACQTLLLVLNELEVFYAFPILFFILSFPILLFNPKNLENIDKLTASYLCVLLLTHALFYLPAFILTGPQYFGEYENALLLLFLVIGLTQGNDVFQFLFGKAFGKNKIVPHLSPNKTEAGFIGGILTTSILGAILFHKLLNLDLQIGLVLAFTTSILGILGDLTFSGIKRYFQIKDFGDSLPGHGGYIDRVDSLIFTSPILYHIIRLTLGTH